MELNLLQISGMLTEVLPRRVSPGGVAQQEVMLRHRSKQFDAGRAREVDLVLRVYLSGQAVKQVDGLQAGDRVVATGYLAPQSYRDPGVWWLHAETLKRQE